MNSNRTGSIKSVKRQFPKRIKNPSAKECDENGDVIFRFDLEINNETDISLEDFYRQSLYDILRIVRPYSKGKPVIIDSFAFALSPDDIIPIMVDVNESRK